jgi:hypothetical protein
VVELLLEGRAEKENYQVLGKDLLVDLVEVDIEEVLEDLQLVVVEDPQMQHHPQLVGEILVEHLLAVVDLMLAAVAGVLVLRVVPLLLPIMEVLAVMDSK